MTKPTDDNGHPVVFGAGHRLDFTKKAAVFSVVWWRGLHYRGVVLRWQMRAAIRRQLWFVKYLWAARGNWAKARRFQRVADKLKVWAMGELRTNIMQKLSEG